MEYHSTHHGNVTQRLLNSNSFAIPAALMEACALLSAILVDYWKYCVQMTSCNVVSGAARLLCNVYIYIFYLQAFVFSIVCC